MRHGLLNDCTYQIRKHGIVACPACAGVSSRAGCSQVFSADQRAFTGQGRRHAVIAEPNATKVTVYHAAENPED